MGLKVSLEDKGLRVLRVLWEEGHFCLRLDHITCPEQGQREFESVLLSVSLLSGRKSPVVYLLWVTR